MNVDIVYEDNHLLVLNKPGGILTQPNGTEQLSLEALGKNYLCKKYEKKSAYLHAIHRLDKQVSGIVVFAKTSKALSRLNENIRSKKTKKIYLAIVEGIISESEGTLENYLYHDDYKAIIVSPDKKDAKKCCLHYKVLKRENDLTYLEIELQTGRYHQIRAQLSYFGYPILGDVKYGSKRKYMPLQIALSHVSFTIPHPITQEIKVFKTNLNLLSFQLPN